MQEQESIAAHYEPKLVAMCQAQPGYEVVLRTRARPYQFWIDPVVAWCEYLAPIDEHGEEGLVLGWEPRRGAIVEGAASLGLVYLADEERDFSVLVYKRPGESVAAALARSDCCDDEINGALEALSSNESSRDERPQRLSEEEEESAWELVEGITDLVGPFVVGRPAGEVVFAFKLICESLQKLVSEGDGTDPIQKPHLRLIRGGKQPP